MAEKYSKEAKIELVAKQGLQYCEEIDEDMLDDDELEQYIHYQHSSHMNDYVSFEEDAARHKYDLGRECDWTHKTFLGERDITAAGKDYLYDMQKRYYEEMASEQDQDLQ